MMSLKVNIGIEEYLDFHRIYFGINKDIKKTINKSRLIGPVFLLLMFFFFQFEREGIWLPIIIFVCLALLWVCFFPVYVKWKSLQRIKEQVLALQNSDIFNEREMFLNENTVKVKSSDEEEEFEWGAFIGFKESKNTIFLFLDESHVLIIPKKQIGPEQEKAIQRILQQKLKQTI